MLPDLSQEVYQTKDTEFYEIPPQTDRGVVAVIPAYNEERFIGSMVITTKAYVDAVFVIDDGSTDDTAVVARAAGAVVISQKTNMGKGAALRIGLQTALQYEGVQAIVLMDGDGQHRPRELPQLVAPILEGIADVVVGSRFLNVRSEIPWWRQIGQHGLTWITNTTSGVLLTDSQSGYRALSPQTAHLMTFLSDGFSVESEMQFSIRENDLRVTEVPISCVYQEPAKRNPIAHGLQVLDGILRMIGQSRPMWFFGVPALLCLLAGLYLGNQVVQILTNTKEFAIGYALVTVLLIILGAVGLSTGILLHSIRSLLVSYIKDLRAQQFQGRFG